MDQRNTSPFSTAVLMALGSVFLMLIAPFSSKAVDVSGTYISEITANTSSNSSLFRKSKHRNLVIVIEQNGSEITGHNDEYNLKISGTLDGDVISFFTWPSDITRNEIKGKWTVNPDGTMMEGTWRHSSSSGKWNLTKGDQATIRALSSDTPKMQRVALAEAAHLSAPGRPLSSFAQFELAPVTLSPGIKKSTKKTIKARELERKLQSKLTPLLRQWNAANGDNADGKLVVRPHIQKLKILGSGTRFLIGAFAGSSFVDMELVLVDASSEKEVSRILIQRSSKQDDEFIAFSHNDERVIDFVVSIAYQYLARNNELTNEDSILSSQSEPEGGKSALDYYGQAEEEIGTQTYDKNLWAKALVEVGGDEQKRKARYIELRADQLYTDKAGSTSNVVPGAQLDSHSDFSGTYRSELSGNLYNHFKRNNIEIRLDQSGKKVTGTFVGAKGYIDGEIDGNTIKYVARPPYGNWSIEGIWAFTDGYNKATGDAGYHVTKGFWNLTKIE